MGLATEDKDLTEPAARLASSSPHLWREFLAALKAYSDGKRDQLVQSPPDVLQVAQGRAQAIQALLGTLSNAPSDANKIADRQSSAQALARNALPTTARGYVPTRTWRE